MLRDIYSDVNKLGKRFAFDLLVVDEAHHIAPAGPSALSNGRGYAVDSQRTVATRELADTCEHRLFLSATPHNGHPESFTALLEMIDDRRFSRGADLDEEALKQVTVRRLKYDLPDLGFPKRQIKTLPFEPDPDEEAAFATLTGIVERTGQRRGRSAQAELLKLLLTKRLLSSPWAFATTLAHYAEAGADTALQQDWDDAYSEVLGSDATDEEEGLVEQPEAVAVRGTKSADPLAAAHAGEIDRLIEWGHGYEYRPDARATALLDFLDAVCRVGDDWSNERVVVFTEYADTLHWLERLLKQHGYDGAYATIHGGTDAEARELIRARFATDPADDPLRVLVATDAAGEGIDLQAYCYRLVNVDVPFNPSRLEQRIGRIDRYGQQHPPEIYYLRAQENSGALAANHEFLVRIAEKVSQVVRDLGSANELIDAQIQQRFLPSVPKRTTKQADDGNALINRALAGGRDLNRQLTELAAGYPEQVARLHARPFNTHRVVTQALALSNQPPLEPIGDEQTDLPVYKVPNLSKQWKAATDGLASRLAPDENRPIVFDAAALRTEEGAGRYTRTRKRDDLVHVHLGHPLTQKAARTLRAAMFGADTRSHRVSGVVVPGLDRSCVAAVSRLVLVGRGGLRLHEEVFFTGLRLGAQDLAEAKVEALLDSALDVADVRPLSAKARRRLADLWNAEGSRMRTRLQRAVQERAARQQNAVAAQLQEREGSDVARAQAIFSQFRRVLTDSLARMHREDEEALEMLFDEQQRQRQRDTEAMRRRLDSLDAEQQREIEALRERYLDVRPFVSAVAVVFAVTEADASAWEE
jgi:superfamily II DNA or RNA helicase